MSKKRPGVVLQVPEPSFDDEHIAHVIDEEDELEIWVQNHWGMYRPIWRNYGDNVEICYTVKNTYVNVLGAIRGAYYWQTGIK